jgi:hypothetical protein
VRRSEFGPALLVALGPFLVSRLLVWIGTVAISPLIPQARVGFDFWHPADPVLRRLFHFDAQYFAVITRYGYSGGPVPPLPPPPYRGAFLPLLPFLARLLGGSEWALLAITNLAFLAALTVLYLLARRRLGDSESKLLLWILALGPASIFFSYAYSESLLLLGIAGTLYGIETKRFGLAGAAALFGAMSRAPGVLLAIPLATEAWRGSRRLPALAATAAPLLGLGIVSLVDLSQLGDPLGWAHGQSLWVLGVHRNPLFPIGQFGRALLTLDPTRIEAYGFPLLVAFLAGTAWALRRLPLGYGLFAVASVVIDVAQSYNVGGFEAIPRYLAVIVPCYFAFASWLAPHSILKVAWLGVSAALLLLFATFFGAWRFVG